MDKKTVLQQIKQSREAMLATLDGLPPDAYLRPGAMGLWSVKDMIAHLTVWYSELITALALIDRPNRVPNIITIEDIDEFNEEQYRANVRRPLDVILEDFEGVYKHLLKAVEAIDEKVLTNPRQFKWMEGEPLSLLVAENAFWHETEHAEAIKQWRTENNL